MPLSLSARKWNRVAIIHDWLVSQRGGENVLDAICELFPSADLYTLIHKVGSTSTHIESLRPRTSILQKFPDSERKYRHFLPLMPWAIERFDLSAYDLILSSSHCVAKGVLKTNPQTLHVSYVHAPMRYMWDRFSEYFSPERAGLITRCGAHIFRPYLQWWDRRSARQVDHFIANSQFIAGRIAEIYQRSASVVYPFCDAPRFSTPRLQPKGDGLTPYLMVTALVPYKRVDLAIHAISNTSRRLVIVGDGPDRERLEALADSNVTFLGSQKNEDLATLYSQCRGLIFPGVEDFGIVPLEAMAAGLPVIAFRAGGVLETVVDGKTGLFFNEPTVSSLKQALDQFEAQQFLESDCRGRAQEFSRQKFQQHYLQEVEKAWLLKQSSTSKQPSSN